MPLSVQVEGIDSNAGRWCKHYLTPGTDASLDWNGIPDSVSGETYKYSNQFEFGISADGLSTCYGYFMTLEDGTAQTSPYAGITGVMGYQIVNLLANMDYFTLWRLPLPDLPAICLFHSTSGYTIGRQTFNTVGMPIFDPNWKPTMIQYGSMHLTGLNVPVIHCMGNTVGSAKWPVGVQPHGPATTVGFSDNLTGYRLAGASMTVTNTASKMYQNGTIVACTADTPLSRPYAYESTNFFNFGTKTLLNTTSGLLSVTDAPLSYDAVSSVKNYHKFEMAEGAYVVLHNLQGEFLFRNPEMDQIPPIYNCNIATGVAMDVLNTDINECIICIAMVNGGDATYIPLIYNGDQHAQYYSVFRDYQTLDVPYPFIDPSSLSLWNSAYVSFKSTDLDNSLSYTVKFNTYAECYVASNSPLKPNVTKSCKFHPGIIDYTSTFYTTHDGIYVAADNDSGAVWKTFKKVLADTADAYFGASPYAPLYTAGKNLVKDLIGGAVKVKEPTKQKYQPDNNKAAKKEKAKQKKQGQPKPKPKQQPKQKQKKTYAEAVKSTSKIMNALNDAARAIANNAVGFQNRKRAAKGKKPLAGLKRVKGMMKNTTNARLEDSVPMVNRYAWVPTKGGNYTYNLADPNQRKQYIAEVRKLRKAQKAARKALKRKAKAIKKLSNDL